MHDTLAKNVHVQPFLSCSPFAKAAIFHTFGSMISPGMALALLRRKIHPPVTGRSTFYEDASVHYHWFVDSLIEYHK